MQDLSQKIKFLKLRKKLWRSYPYGLYIKLYDFFIKMVLQLNKKNVKIIFINGMRRSGNHYLMKTLMNSTSSSVVYYNNQKSLKNLDIRNGLQVKFRASKKIVLIIGYEDLLINNFIDSCNYILESNFSDVENIKMIIIRDIRNMMASRLNHAHMAKDLRRNNSSIDNARSLWLNHNDLNTSECHRIRYGSLISDLSKIKLKSYFISSLSESKKVLNRYGGGSSFKNSNFNSRYTSFLNDKTYESLTKDFKELDEEIHGVW